MRTLTDWWLTAMSDEAMQFVRDTVYGWVGNLMRDMDAQGTPLDPKDIATALEQVAYEVDQQPTKEEFDDFLRDLNDGRGTE